MITTETDSEREERGLRNVESCRSLYLKLAEECAKHGATMEDIAIAATYSLIDLATAHKGNPHDAIEWARKAMDIHERALLTAARAAH